MIRWNSVVAAGERGADALKSYVSLQWVFLYAVIAFGIIAAIAVFTYFLSRLFGKLRFDRKQERLHRELRAQLEERDELLQKSERKQQQLRDMLRNLQDRLDVMDNKLYRVDALNESVNKLESSNVDLVSDIKKLSSKAIVKVEGKRKVGRPRKMRKAPQRS